MSNLRRIKSFVFACKPRTEFASGRGLPCDWTKLFIFLRINKAAEWLGSIAKERVGCCCLFNKFCRSTRPSYKKNVYAGSVNITQYVSPVPSNSLLLVFTIPYLQVLIWRPHFPLLRTQGHTTRTFSKILQTLSTVFPDCFLRFKRHICVS